MGQEHQLEINLAITRNVKINGWGSVPLHSELSPGSHVEIHVDRRSETMQRAQHTSASGITPQPHATPDQHAFELGTAVAGIPCFTHLSQGMEWTNAITPWCLACFFHSSTRSPLLGLLGERGPSKQGSEKHCLGNKERPWPDGRRSIACSRYRRPAMPA